MVEYLLIYLIVLTFVDISYSTDLKFGLKSFFRGRESEISPGLPTAFAKIQDHPWIVLEPEHSKQSVQTV